MAGSSNQSEITAADRANLGQAVGLLDQVIRSTQRSAITLHAVAAHQLISPYCPNTPGSRAGGGYDERGTLQAALGVFGRLSAEALCEPDIADGAHHTMLAYLAAR